MPRVSVFIPSFNRPEHLRECVQAILESEYPDFELLILDQSASTESADLMMDLDDERIRYFHLDRPGKSRALNFGIGKSRSDILCFTDDDCLPSSAWISAIVREFDGDPDLGMLLGQTLPRFIGPANRPAFAYYESPVRRVYEKRRNPYDVGGAGGNMAFRRQTILAVGPFDVDFGPGARFKALEDNEYFYRVFSQGFRAIYCPEMLVHHKQLHSRDQVGRIYRNYRLGEAAFIGKYLGRMDFRPLYYYLSYNSLRIGDGLVHLKPRKIRQSLFSFFYVSRGMVHYFRHRPSSSRRGDGWAVNREETF